MNLTTSSISKTVWIVSCCVFLVVVEQASAQNAPAIFPSNTGYQIRFKDGKLEVIQFLNSNSAELWEDRLASIFIFKSTLDKMDMTADQEAKLNLLAKSHERFHNDVLAPNSVKFNEQATDENGRLDYKKYTELMEQNAVASKEFNAQLTKQMYEIVRPHQWREAAELVTRATLRNEGVARHLVTGEFAAYMKMSAKQKDDLKRVASKLVIENDAMLEKLARDSVQKMLAVLDDEQLTKLLEVMGVEDPKALEATNIVILNEQLRQFVRDFDNGKN